LGLKGDSKLVPTGHNLIAWDTVPRKIMTNKPVHDALFGVAVGDALGVPVEFQSRVYLKKNPVVEMLGYHTHNQPLGTWSDDSSLTLCLAEMLCKNYDLKQLAKYFIEWYENAYWTAHNEMFDVGITTSQAIQILKNVKDPTLAGGQYEHDNGNGSLMRILPLVFYIKNMSIEKRYQIVKDVSSLTHAHIRSVISCFIYIEMALQLLKNQDKWLAFENTIKIVNEFLNKQSICSQNEIENFHRILQSPIGNKKIIPMHEYFEAEIYSSGYVLHSLEASFWCLLTSNSYKEAVLKAVNLGGDTDTTGAITGGLAGLLYGYDAIPKEWIEVLARKDDIDDLCNRLERKYF
jgi:ADP-ribosyl-[dinitrogen reductase] hydrolase